MPQPGPQPYDTLAEAYQQSKQLSFRTHIEAFTLFKLLGSLGGKRVIDLACGEGFYTRGIKLAGATDVLGVDISQAMVDLAVEQEKRSPAGVRYLCADAANLKLAAGGEADVVAAAYLLNYARTPEQLLAFCRAAWRVLKPGGRFAGFNDNPNRDPNAAPSFAAYGFEKRCPRNRREGDEIIYEIAEPGGGSFVITNYYLSPETYAWAFAEAGFADFAWAGPWLRPEQTGNSFWADFMEHAPLIGFAARKP